MKRRLAWAKEFKHFTMDDWLKVMWSDECYIFLSNEHQRIYVTRRPDEEYHPDCLVPRFPQSNIRIMVWACIMHNAKGLIVVLEYPGGKGGGYEFKAVQGTGLGGCIG